MAKPRWGSPACRPLHDCVGRRLVGRLNVMSGNGPHRPQRRVLRRGETLPSSSTAIIVRKVTFNVPSRARSGLYAHPRFCNGACGSTTVTADSPTRIAVSSQCIHLLSFLICHIPSSIVPSCLWPPPHAGRLHFNHERPQQCSANAVAITGAMLVNPPTNQVMALSPMATQRSSVLRNCASMDSRVCSRRDGTGCLHESVIFLTPSAPWRARRCGDLAGRSSPAPAAAGP
jgi:hypothetical protein